MAWSRVWMVSVLIATAVGRPAEGQYYPALADAARRYWDALMERYPTWATSLGDHRFDDRLEDVSEEGRLAWKGRLEGKLEEVRKIRHQWLSEPDQLTRALLTRAIRDELLKLECRQDYTPLDPLYGPHIRLPLVLVSQPFRSLDDYRRYAARLRAFGPQVTDTIANMRSGIALGWVHPKVIVEKVIPQVRAHLVGEVRDSVFYAPLERAGALVEADRALATAEITDAIASDVIPAYLQLLAFIEDEYLYEARDTIGLGSVSNGDRLYIALASLHTTIQAAPEQIHAQGLGEVARIRNEMAAVQREIGFEGPLEAFLAHMRTDPVQRFDSAAEIVAAADAILKRTAPAMSELFGRLPAADCVMKVIEPYRAAAAPAAFYNAASDDGSRPGYYYINTYRPQERLRFTLEALTYHEAIPGHHLQADLSRQNRLLPDFRRHASCDAFVEGWGLYAEKLGYEIGGYREPQARFGQLTFEMWRACRLVVDTGIHAKGWTRRQAVDYLAANTSLTMHDIEAEVDRYIAWPGQALAYKIGELRLLALRREAEKVLGERFDLRAFHDTLLGGGAMPLETLEESMRAWIQSQRL